MRGIRFDRAKTVATLTLTKEYGPAFAEGKFFLERLGFSGTIHEVAAANN
jgi:hypothetical protein